MLETDAIVEMLETCKAERLSSFTATKRDSEDGVRSQATSGAKDSHQSSALATRVLSADISFPHKAGVSQKRFYKRLIAKADELFVAHLAQRKAKRKAKGT